MADNSANSRSPIRSGGGGGFQLSVCPFSLFVFIATAILVTQQRRKEQAQQITKNNNDTSTNRIPLYVVFVLGAPGVGKGTQCKLLSERLSSSPSSSSSVRYVHLSAGDLLRAERAKQNSKLATEINQFIDAGQLVPSHITCQLLINAMIDTYDTTHKNSGTSSQQQPVTHFLIDGFPRSKSNLDVWNQMTTSNDSIEESLLTTTSTASTGRRFFTYHVQFVLNYTCPEETLIGRILERGKTQSRSDDNIVTIQTRFRTFYNETTPILEYYQQRYDDKSDSTSGSSDSTTPKIPVYTIPTDQPIESVYQQTIQYFQYW